MSGLQRTIGALGAAGFCLAVAVGEVGNAPNTRDRDYMKCGPNSLFLYLILSGHPEVTLQALQDIPVSSDGTSLRDLRNTARKFEIDAEIRRYRLEDIDSMPLPAIGQFATGPPNSPHHFDVIYKVDAQRMYLIDGTSGSKRYVLRPRLPGFWTGVAMAEKRSVSMRIVQGCPLVFSAACLLVVDTIVLLLFMRWLESTAKVAKSLSEAGVRK